MSASVVFHDTNVLLYVISADAAKAARSEALLGDGGQISVQVLNEFASVASRKKRMAWAEIGEFLAKVRTACRVEPLTPETHDRALALAQRHHLHIYDATIAAAALMAGCRTLYSEDFQHGQVFEGKLEVVNPFL